jgi:N-acetylneuraminic acid mutarotase
MAEASLSPRWAHAGVWTGAELLVWGGRGGAETYGDGARYEPDSDSWTPLSAVAAPAARRHHTAVWSGSEMVVWGGADSDGKPLATGGRYDPSTDTWKSVSVMGAPAARRYHTAIWTGKRMLVWGGSVEVVSGGIKKEPRHQNLAHRRKPGRMISPSCALAA